MKNIRFAFFTSILILSHFINAQTVEHIRTSGLYNFGIGSGENYAVARKNALQNLTEGISVHIKSEFEHIVRETNGNIDDYSNSIVKTYSSAVINQYQEKVIAEKQGAVELMLYISKVDLEKVFYERELIIRDLIALGEKSERELRIGDALRNYYWAMVLTRSHPNNKNLRHDFGNNTQLSILKGLSDRIESIFTRLKFTPTSVDQKSAPAHKQINLAISFNDQPVQNLDYTYFTGDGFSGITSIRDGKGIANVDGPFAAQMQILRLKVEYQYANKAHLEPEIKQMMENVTVPYFDKAEVRIDLKSNPVSGSLTKSQSPAQTLTQNQSQTPINNQSQTPAQPPAAATFSKVDSNTPEYATYVTAIEKVMAAIRANNHKAIQSQFSPEGWEIYNKLITNGNVTVLQAPADTLRVLKFGKEVVVRSVPMLFAFNNNKTKFVEKVVFTFNEQAKICNLAFALGQKATDDILQKPIGFGTLEEKYFLIRFMENYKTAYSLKRADYLEALFDENALIIVGNRVQKAPQPTDQVRNMYGNFSNEQVEYITLSKSEYLERVKRVFQRNEFVNIHFEENEVRKTQRNDKIYGIQIAQHYYSSTYADKGYLFLMIDLNDTIQPKIYVRTWQPTKNADGSVIGIEDFRF
jgi:hypothetical protein